MSLSSRSKNMKRHINRVQLNKLASSEFESYYQTWLFSQIPLYQLEGFFTVSLNYSDSPRNTPATAYLTAFS